YGENLSDFFYRAGYFVDKIFKGAKPGDLPIQQPTLFHLVINRTTANALGLPFRFRSTNSPTRSSNEGARVHRASCRRDSRLAAYFARAADDNAGRSHS